MEPYTTQNPELVSPIGFFKDGILLHQHYYADTTTLINSSDKLSPRLRKIDRHSYSRQKLRLQKFIDMSRDFFSDITPNERIHLIYYCKKLDQLYNKRKTHIFYLALLQLGKFSPFEAYHLYPFSETLSLSTAFRYAAELNLNRKPNLKYRYLSPILLDFPLPDMEKFITYYNTVFDEMIHTCPQSRVKYCLRLFYHEMTSHFLAQLFKVKKHTLQESFNTFRRHYPHMANGLYETARAIRYE